MDQMTGDKTQLYLRNSRLRNGGRVVDGECYENIPWVTASRVLQHHVLFTTSRMSYLTVFTMRQGGVPSVVAKPRDVGSKWVQLLWKLTGVSVVVLWMREMLTSNLTAAPRDLSKPRRRLKTGTAGQTRTHVYVFRVYIRNVPSLMQLFGINLLISDWFSRRCYV